MNGAVPETWEVYRGKAVKVVGPWIDNILSDHVSYAGTAHGRPMVRKHSGALGVATRQYVTGEPCVTIHKQPYSVVAHREFHIVESPLGAVAAKPVEGTIDQIKQQLDAALREAGYTLFDQ